MYHHILIFFLQLRLHQSLIIIMDNLGLIPTFLLFYNPREKAQIIVNVSTFK